MSHIMEVLGIGEEREVVMLTLYSKYYHSGHYHLLPCPALEWRLEPLVLWEEGKKHSSHRARTKCSSLHVVGRAVPWVGGTIVCLEFLYQKSLHSSFYPHLAFLMIILYFEGIFSLLCLLLIQLIMASWVGTWTYFSLYSLKYLVVSSKSSVNVFDSGSGDSSGNGGVKDHVNDSDDNLMQLDFRWWLHRHHQDIPVSCPGRKLLTFKT